MITLYENVPQFMVATYEMFDCVFSVNFIKAANFIITVFMFYKSLGTIFDDALYDMGICGFALVLFTFFLPQVYVSMRLNKKIQELPQSLIEASIFKPKSWSQTQLPMKTNALPSRCHRLAIIRRRINVNQEVR